MSMSLFHKTMDGNKRVAVRVNMKEEVRKINKYFINIFITNCCSCKACFATIFYRVNSTATAIKNVLDSKPIPLDCSDSKRLSSKKFGYKNFNRSRFIDISVCDKYTEFDPYMKINYKQIGCDISYG